MKKKLKKVEAPKEIPSHTVYPQHVFKLAYEDNVQRLSLALMRIGYLTSVKMEGSSYVLTFYSHQPYEEKITK